MLQNKRTRVGSEEQYGPRPVGEILQDYFEKSNEPLARAYRDHVFKDLHPHTEPCCQLKLLTHKSGRMPVGTCLYGAIAHDKEIHFTFIEEALEKKVRRRNLCIYEGKHITCTKSLDGTVRLNFRNLKRDAFLNVDGYALEVANEIREALKGFVEEE